MQRDCLAQMKERNSSGLRRKPLIMMGARQVGKTWLLHAFAQECYPENMVFVDLHDDGLLREAIEDGAADTLGILELIATAKGEND